jgi:hypothetical protein
MEGLMFFSLLYWDNGFLRIPQRWYALFIPAVSEGRWCQHILFLVIINLFFELGVLLFCPGSLKLLDSSDLPASPSWGAGIKVVHHHAHLGDVKLDLLTKLMSSRFLCYKISGFSLFFVVSGFEFRASCFLDRCFSIRAMAPAWFSLFILCLLKVSHSPVLRRLRQEGSWVQG